MTGKYFVELKDKFHIVTVEKLEGVEGDPIFKMLKPRDDDVFSLETESYNDFWLWLKDEKSFLPGENLDICFLCPDEISVKPLIDSIRCIEVNVSEVTDITVDDAKVFLQMTDRNLEDVRLFDDKTILYFGGKNKLFAINASGNGLKASPEKSVVQPQEINKSSKSTTKKSVRQRPKAFKSIPISTETSAIPSIVPTKEKNEQPLENSVASNPLHQNNTIPKATASDIQIGIKKITEDQCQDVDFRD